MAKRKVCAKCHWNLEKPQKEEKEKEEEEEEEDREEEKTVPKSKIAVPIIWILGGPGSGKGEQADRITERFGFCHISAGNFLIREIRSRSPTSKSLLKIVGSGNLPPTDIILKAIEQEIYDNLPTAKGYVIDGYPSTGEEGLIFERHIASPTLIIFLDVPSDVLVSRLMQRAKISGRDDDNYESVQKRLQIHYDTKDGLLMQFKEKVKIVNADRPARDIFEEIKRYVSPLVN